jgi:hypothetical protein
VAVRGTTNAERLKEREKQVGNYTLLLHTIYYILSNTLNYYLYMITLVGSSAYPLTLCLPQAEERLHLAKSGKSAGVPRELLTLLDAGLKAP